MKKNEVDTAGSENVMKVESVDHPEIILQITTTSFSTVAEDTPSSSAGTIVKYKTLINRSKIKIANNSAFMSQYQKREMRH